MNQPNQQPGAADKLTTAQTIKAITRDHLTNGNGLLLGQCVTAVGWIGGTVPDCQGIVEIPMTDVAGPAFAVGCALAKRRPIFVVRYQGFMWYNSSSLINYAAKSKAVWNQPVPIFIRAISMEGHGIGHTASSSFHALFMHSPGLPVAAPMTPEEYRSVWRHFLDHDDPIYVSEHRRSFELRDEMPDEIHDGAQITLIAISAARLNTLKAAEVLRQRGVLVNIVHLVWLKPFTITPQIRSCLIASQLGLVIDSGFEIAGASRSIAYELTLDTGVPVHALGLKDEVCGAAARVENITPSAETIAETVLNLVRKK